MSSILPLSGYVDGCQARHVVGWAVDGAGPAIVNIELNGRVIGECRCDQPRPDVAAATGLPENCGFVFRFPRPLDAADKGVAVRFRDGTHLGNSPSPHHALRVARLAHGITETALGLEFGALDAPFLRRPPYNVLHVDHVDKKGCVEKYRLAGEVGQISPDQIVDVDIVWPAGDPLLGSVVGNRRFDYAVASQVIEHIADPIGWLREIASVLRSGARLNLSIPDKRYTFDRDRSLSTAADILDAHVRNLKRPTFRQIFDHRVSTTAREAMPCDPPEFYRRVYRGTLDWEREERYVDVHCYVWTYGSFLECWQIIGALDLVPLALDEAWEPIDGANEFIVSLRKE